MLDSWNSSIFSNSKDKLQYSAMKLVHAERNGEAFDSQLVIGVRESYVNLSSDTDDKLKIYRDNFEKAYLEAAENFYKQVWLGWVSQSMLKVIRNTTINPYQPTFPGFSPYD